MDNANFDELLAKLIEKCHFGESIDENATLRSSKLSEIDSMIKNIDKQLGGYDSWVSNALKYYESKIIVVSNIQREQANIRIQETNWDEFEASINSQISAFLEIRKSFLDLIKKEELSNQKYQEHCQNIEKTKFQITYEKKCVSDEISKVDDNIETLKSQIQETRSRINSLQIENSIFRDCLEKEERKWRHRADEAEEKFQKIFTRSQKREFH